MKIVAFAASSSRSSINKQLVHYACSLLKNADIEVLDLNDYALPLFSVDVEAELGHPPAAKAFLAKIASADAVLISFAEHNGSYTAAFKNLFDWCSRINNKVYQQKNMVLLSTSPGPRGGASVLAAAVNSAPFFDGNVLASLSIPSFNDNFSLEQGKITNPALNEKLIKAVNSFHIG